MGAGTRVVDESDSDEIRSPWIWRVGLVCFRLCMWTAGTLGHAHPLCGLHMDPKGTKGLFVVGVCSESARTVTISGAVLRTLYFVEEDLALHV